MWALQICTRVILWNLKFPLRSFFKCMAGQGVSPLRLWGNFDLHKVYKQITAWLAIYWLRSQDNGGEERTACKNIEVCSYILTPTHYQTKTEGHTNTGYYYGCVVNFYAECFIDFIQSVTGSFLRYLVEQNLPTACRHQVLYMVCLICCNRTHRKQMWREQWKDLPSSKMFKTANEIYIISTCKNTNCVIKNSKKSIKTKRNA